MTAVIEAIKNRRSSAYVLEKEIQQEHLEQILDAACWAPTHHKTQPWQFHVYSGDARAKLTELYVAGVEAQKESLEEAVYIQRLEKAKTAAFRAPVVISVSCLAGRSDRRNPPVWEDEAAVSAATQNMLLAAESLGIASYWRTGWFTELETIRSSYGLTDKDRVMGYIYLGYKDESKPAPIRPDPKQDGKIYFVS